MHKNFKMVRILRYFSSRNRLSGHICALLLGLVFWAGPATAGGPVVTDLERITGRFVGPGVTCPQFRLDSGETISLSGLPERKVPKDRTVVLEGRWQSYSTCMQGRDFLVSTLDPTD